ncbi:hypothetical protein JCGZ_05845 [Jatropha curcas]|uniref:Uncharacterized protein n=1 Tax=Jatropha curcas TaxID=180498 RepID=A0A067J8I7_JATCU|nr:hypothetical protein JCGZ_05845 [Jatropha curcas]
MAAVSAITVSAKNKANSTAKHSDTSEKDGLRLEEEEEKEESSDALWKIKEYEERKVKLERKLLELHTLKKQESYADRNELFREIKEGFLARMDLEMATKLIEKMERKMDSSCAKHLKERLMMLQEQVFGFHSGEFDQRDAALEGRMKGIKDFELEILETKRKNKVLGL